VACGPGNNGKLFSVQRLGELLVGLLTPCLQEAMGLLPLDTSDIMATSRPCIIPREARMNSTR
jgi:hypothetical protein